jgi:hypothetical protein
MDSEIGSTTVWKLTIKTNKKEVASKRQPPLYKNL